MKNNNHSKNEKSRDASLLPLSLAILSLLLLISFLASGCTKDIPLPGDIYICSADSDCIPKPGCHPMECINLKYESMFKQPEMCTEIFMFSAAYTKEDCACENNLCINKNNHPASAEKACESDSDCACGKHIRTGDCFYGNKQYVDTTSQCPDFCTGIAGNLQISCQRGMCTQLNIG